MTLPRVSKLQDIQRWFMITVIMVPVMAYLEIIPILSSKVVIIHRHLTMLHLFQPLTIRELFSGAVVWLRAMLSTQRYPHQSCRRTMPIVSAEIILDGLKDSLESPSPTAQQSLQGQYLQ
jgi:hypothetical protein